MSLKLLLKTGYMGVSGGLAWISTIIYIPDKPTIKQPKTINPPAISKMDSISDIKLFEKQKGCKYIYHLNNKGAYDAEEIIKQKKERGWKSTVIYDANFYKQYCNKGKTVNLIENRWGTGYRIKQSF